MSYFPQNSFLVTLRVLCPLFSLLLRVPSCTTVSALRDTVASEIGVPKEDLILIAMDESPARTLSDEEGRGEEQVGNIFKDNACLRIRFLGDAAARTDQQMTAIDKYILKISKKPVPGQHRSSPGQRSMKREAKNSVKRRHNVPSSSPSLDLRLIESVSKQHSRDNVTTALRSDFKRALELQYNISKAEARLNAARSEMFTFSGVTFQGNYLSALHRNTNIGKVDVSFPAGLGSRSETTETFDLLSQELLKAVIAMMLDEGRTQSNALQDNGSGLRDELDIEAKGNGFISAEHVLLKPVNLAGVSPRIFWSLVYHFGSDLTNGFKSLFPNRDWKWLNERTRTLSAKAQENLKQQRKSASRCRKRKVEGNVDVSDVEDVENSDREANDDNAGICASPLSCTFRKSGRGMDTLLSLGFHSAPENLVLVLKNNRCSIRDLANRASVSSPSTCALTPYDHLITSLYSSMGQSKLTSENSSDEDLFDSFTAVILSNYTDITINTSLSTFVSLFSFEFTVQLVLGSRKAVAMSLSSALPAAALGMGLRTGFIVSSSPSLPQALQELCCAMRLSVRQVSVWRLSPDALYRNMIDTLNDANHRLQQTLLDPNTITELKGKISCEGVAEMTQLAHVFRTCCSIWADEFEGNIFELSGDLVSSDEDDDADDDSDDEGEES